MSAAAPKSLPSFVNGRHETPVSEELVRSELGRILQSSAFRGSRRSQAFLRYVVEKTLALQLSDLKERHLAVELFDRSPAANLSEDAIVRVRAREVRRRLQQYYASAEGAGALLQIDLSPGSYVPKFRRPESRLELLKDLGPGDGEPVAHQRAGRRLFPWWGAWVLLSVAILGLLGWAFWRESGISPDAALAEVFWRPVMSAGEEVLIGVPNPIVYQPSDRTLRGTSKRQPAPEEIPLQPALALHSGKRMAPDYVAVENKYVTFGDLLAASHLSAMLTLQQKRARLMFSSKIDPADLKKTASIQIGAYSNSWTLELGRNLRFRFSHTQDGRSCILDAANPGRLWAPPALTGDGASGQDYLLITRLLSGRLSQPAVLVAGLEQGGTVAGGQLLSNPQRLGDVLRSIGNVSWSNANLQILLEMRVVGNTPSAPHLVAWHLW